MDMTIPSELIGPLPRKVRITGSGAWILFIALAAVVFALLSFSWGAINLDRQMTRRVTLRREGSIVAGQVSRIRRGKNMDHVDYNFNVNGKEYTGTADLPWQLRRDVERSSDALPISYLPQDPDVNHPAGWEWSFYYWIPLKTDLVHLPDFSTESQFFMVALMATAIGIVFALSLRGERKLLANGVAAAGVVTKCTPGSRGSYFLRYEFHAEDGSLTKGKCGGDRRDVGARLCILYLPHDTSKSQLYPTQFYRVTE